MYHVYVFHKNISLQYILVLSFQYVICFLPKEDHNKLIQYFIEENQPAGLVIGKISEDIKRHSNPIWLAERKRDLQFSFSKENSLFEMDSKTGLIKSKQVIDLEQLCPENCNKDRGIINLTVNIWFQSSLQDMAMVSIIVEDVNDNYPTFEKESVEFNLKETLYSSGKTIKLPKATDKDISQKNKDVNYKLKEESGHFDIVIDNKIQPILLLKKTLDSEETTRFHLVLLAWNTYFPNSIHSSLNIIINVVNMNDNEPFFTKTLYLIPVPENTVIGSMVHQLSATDLDVESKLSYWPEDPSSSVTSAFKVHVNGSIELLCSLDYESQVFYELSVKVSDGEFNASTKLKFVVIDVNDQAPYFVQNFANLSIYENSEPFDIGQMTIFDRDSEDQNGRIKCYEPDHLRNKQIVSFIPNANNYLQYTVRLVQRLDRDVRDGDFQHATFICEDNGIPTKLTATFTITIQVLDRNDNSPVFTTFSTNITVKENSPIKNVLYQFEAVDKDKGPNGEIHYEIEYNQTNERCCHINRLTGTLYSLNVLDREKRDFYQLIITATDQSLSEKRFTTSLSVTINILDENDHAPILLPPFNFTLLENHPPLTFIGTLKAKDEDIGENGKVKFSLISNHHSSFGIYKNGSLYSKKSFDREEQELYCLQILVEDLGMEFSNSLKSRICIKILDENDNTPIIVLPEFEKTSSSISENKSISYVQDVIYRLNVSVHRLPYQPFAYIWIKDNDTGHNGNVSLQLTSDDIPKKNILRIDPIDDEKYELILIALLSKSTKECYQYTIRVSDHGKPSKSNKKIIQLCFVNSAMEMPRLLEKDRFLSISKANILIVIILVGTSAFLTALLVSAILCMIQPCKELSRRHYSHRVDDRHSLNLHLNEPIMDNLLKSCEEYEEQIFCKISETQINHQSNDDANLQDEWVFKILGCNESNCRSMIIPQSVIVTSSEEQRSDSGKGASDEDNPFLISSSHGIRLHQLNRSKQPPNIGPQNQSELHLLHNFGCVQLPSVTIPGKQILFSDNPDPHNFLVCSETPSKIPISRRIGRFPKRNNPSLVMENCIHKANDTDNCTTLSQQQTSSPIHSLTEIGSHIDHLFLSQCCKKY